MESCSASVPRGTIQNEINREINVPSGPSYCSVVIYFVVTIHRPNSTSVIVNKFSATVFLADEVRADEDGDGLRR